MFKSVCIVVLGSIISQVTSDPTQSITSNESSISSYALTRKAFQSSAKDEFSPRYLSQYISKIPSSILHPSVISPLSEETLNSFTKQFVDALAKIPSLQKVWKIYLSPSATRKMFYSLDKELLSDCGNKNADATAYNISEAVSNIKDLTIPLYFEIVAKTLVKFLVFEKKEIGHHIILMYSDCVKNFVDTADLDNVYLLFKALLDGFICFVESCGFYFPEKTAILSEFFIDELIAATHGNKS